MGVGNLVHVDVAACNRAASDAPVAANARTAVTTGVVSEPGCQVSRAPVTRACAVCRRATSSPRWLTIIKNANSLTTMSAVTAKVIAVRARAAVFCCTMPPPENPRIVLLPYERYK